MNGTSADINNIEGILHGYSLPIGKTPIGSDWQNGTGNSADLPTSANPQKEIGSGKAVKNQGLCQPANQNTDSIEETSPASLGKALTEVCCRLNRPRFVKS